MPWLEVGQSANWWSNVSLPESSEPAPLALAPHVALAVAIRRLGRRALVKDAPLAAGAVRRQCGPDERWSRRLPRKPGERCELPADLRQWLLGVWPYELLFGQPHGRDVPALL